MTNQCYVSQMRWVIVLENLKVRVQMKLAILELLLLKGTHKKQMINWIPGTGPGLLSLKN